jgi:DDE superfamily endonuclease
LKQQWCIPPKQDAEFVCQMEDVLEVYKRPYDPNRPVICLDEASKQLIGETRLPIPASPGQPERVDHEYIRNGTVNLFMLSEPLAGIRLVEVTQQRTAVDFAKILALLADDLYPEVEKIVLVMDNLNTHKMASLYQAFEPAEARRLAERFEVHHTPKHGSWLNMAEIELSVLSGQCLDQRFTDQESLQRAVEAWLVERNERCVGVNWQFRTEEARIKLKRLYPIIQT